MISKAMRLVRGMAAAGKRRVAEEVEQFNRPVVEYIAREEAEREGKSAATVYWQNEYKRKKGAK